MPQAGPKVLLTTVPQEQHSLGLLMVGRCWRWRVAPVCVAGHADPLTDIAQAALAHRADVVALSFSNLQKRPWCRPACASCAQLPAPPRCGWAARALAPPPMAAARRQRRTGILSGLQPLVAVAPRPLTRKDLPCSSLHRTLASARPLSAPPTPQAAGPAGGRHWPAAGRLRQHAPAARRDMSPR